MSSLPSVKYWLPLIAIAALIPLGGCSSIARGVTEALVDNGPEVDNRQCEVEGPAFDGVRQSLEAQSPQSPKITKVLMVHGISSHLPGYSSRLQKQLYEKLSLTKTDSQVKAIQLDSANILWDKDEPHVLGMLRVSRHTDDSGERQLLFYELTWSSITDPQKQQLAADSANNEGLQRASLNNSLKGFMNATVPDLLIYNGNGYDRITTAVTQSVCWMIADDWNDLPNGGAHQCEPWPGSTFASLEDDDHFFITHSLGSRITIDTIQNFASQTRTRDTTPKEEERLIKVGQKVRNKDFTVFMMANQLPLLQMGRSAPSVSAEEKTYCAADADKAEQRVIRKMNIIAFSDPNDILSYPVPLDFASNSIDSRICPQVTNVSLNVATQKSLFDAASFANPLTAHSGYMEDDRVIDLIANGIKGGSLSPLIAERCKWLETVQETQKEKS